MNTLAVLEQLGKDARRQSLMGRGSLKILEGLTPWGLRAKRDLAVQVATVLQGVGEVFLLGSLARRLVGSREPVNDIDLLVVADFFLDDLMEVVPKRRAGYALEMEEFVTLFREIDEAIGETLLSLDPDGDLIDLILLPAQMTRENMVRWAEIAGRMRDRLFIRSLKNDLLVFSGGEFVRPEALPWEQAVEEIFAEGMTLEGGHDDEPLGQFYGDFGDLQIFLPKDRARELTRRLGDRLERDLLVRYAPPSTVLWHDLKRVFEAIQ